MRVVVAPDKFKGSLTAAQVAAHLAKGLRSARPTAAGGASACVAEIPVADGGDGTLAAVAAAGFSQVPVPAHAADTTVIATAYARRGDCAVIELAAACGLVTLRGRLAPMTASSRGAGDVVAAALDAGCTHVVVGIGGSASTDGGIGFLQALGARVTDVHGHDVGPGGQGALAAHHLDLGGLHPGLRHAVLEMACDVTNPLTGPSGAAAVFGRQKGADAGQVRSLDTALARWADVVAATIGSDLRDASAAGAAGGVGFAGAAVLGARLRSGVELVLDQVGFASEIAGADLVVTGEGALDEQTLAGKAPLGVAAAASAAGLPVVAVVGRCDLDRERWSAAGFRAVYALLDEPDGPTRAVADPGPLLERIGRRIGDGVTPVRAAGSRSVRGCHRP